MIQVTERSVESLYHIIGAVEVQYGEKTALSMCLHDLYGELRKLHDNPSLRTDSSSEKSVQYLFESARDIASGNYARLYLECIRDIEQMVLP